MTSSDVPRLIGLAGYIGVGKTTIAREIVTQYDAENPDKDAVVCSFAHPLKVMMESLLCAMGYNPLAAGSMVLFREHREVPVEVLSHRTMRHALQTLGTEWGRECMGPTFWANAGLRAALSTGADLIVFDDCRFGTEAEIIRMNGGHVCWLERKGVQRTSSHSSEDFNFPFDMVCGNNGDPGETARSILKELSV